MKGIKTMNVTVYYADIKPLYDEKLFDKYFSLVPQERKEKINCLALRDDKKRSLAAGVLLSFAQRNSGFDPDKTEYKIGKNGKPFIKGAEKFHFNLSHSGDYAVIAFSQDGDVGVDIEKIRDTNFNIAKRFFHSDEYESINASAEEEKTELFFRYWTLKESYLKATGTGFFRPINSFKILIDESNDISVKTADGEDEGYSFFEIPEIKGYALSLCGAERELTVKNKEVALSDGF